jgi:hypothetical protein
VIVRYREISLGALTFIMTYGPDERPVTGAVLTRTLLTFVAPTPERVHRSGAGPGTLIESVGAAV